jgi:predicted nucleic acid-binding protein
MRRIFADTFYWIAVLNPHDQAHARAVALSETLQPAQIITSDEVLTEFLNYFAESGEFHRRAAARMVERIYADHTMRVFPQTRDGFLTGLGLYRARPDKGYSLTDCVSMDLMRRTWLIDVLTDDTHFAQEGVSLLAT